jgi:quercetin dioxygenase-like cupin family protein
MPKGCQEIAQYTNLLELEKAIREHIEPVEFHVDHYFINGVYVRAIVIPKNHIVTGRIHKHECINIMAKGKMVITDEHGLRRYLGAGDIFVSHAGTKRAVYAEDDSVYVTVHHTFKTDIDAVEDYLVCNSVNDYIKYLENVT